MFWLSVIVLTAAPPPEGGCGGRFGCVDHPPAWYDQFIETAEGPTDATDTACLQRLTATGIEHRLLTGVRGVTTPVEVLDETVGNVRYVPADPDRRRLILDCHMVEVLAARGRAIRQARVSTLHWSSSWRYTYRKGTETLSAHAHGNALDVVAIEGDFGYATVRGHYPRGNTGCGQDLEDGRAAALRGLVCALTGENAFAEVYTPDTDADHEDHLHVEGPNPEIRHAVRRREAPRRWWQRYAVHLGVLGGGALALLLGGGIWLRRRQSRHTPGDNPGAQDDRRT